MQFVHAISCDLAVWLCIYLALSLSYPHTYIHIRAGKVKHRTNLVQILRPTPPEGKALFEVGPALFGPVLGVDMIHVSAELDVKVGKEGSVMSDGCQVFSEEEAAQSKGKVVMVMRGGCLFVQKVRRRGKVEALSGCVYIYTDVRKQEGQTEGSE